MTFAEINAKTGNHCRANTDISTNHNPYTNAKDLTNPKPTGTNNRNRSTTPGLAPQKSFHR